MKLGGTGPAGPPRHGIQWDYTGLGLPMFATLTGEQVAIELWSKHRIYNLKKSQVLQHSSEAIHAGLQYCSSIFFGNYILQYISLIGLLLHLL